MRVVLIAPPGGGKGTQGVRIANRYRLTHIATGDLFRAEVRSETEVGKQIVALMSKGDLVPDDVVEAVLRGPVERAVASGGYVLDGFPRTVDQATLAREIASTFNGEAEVVIYIDVPAEDLVARLLRRAEIEGRADDNEVTIRHRLEVFESSTRPLIDHYRDIGILRSVDGTKSISEVSDQIYAALDPLDTRFPQKA